MASPPGPQAQESAGSTEGGRSSPDLPGYQRDTEGCSPCPACHKEGSTVHMAGCSGAEPALQHQQYQPQNHTRRCSSPEFFRSRSRALQGVNVQSKDQAEKHVAATGLASKTAPQPERALEAEDFHRLAARTMLSSKKRRLDLEPRGAIVRPGPITTSAITSEGGAADGTPLRGPLEPALESEKTDVSLQCLSPPMVGSSGSSLRPGPLSCAFLTPAKDKCSFETAIPCPGAPRKKEHIRARRQTSESLRQIMRPLFPE